MKMFATVGSRPFLVGICAFLVLTIVWQLYESSSQLDVLREQVENQEHEITAMTKTVSSTSESSEMLWEEVMREAQGLVRHEEDVYVEQLIKLSKEYVDKETVNETVVKQYVLEEVEKFVVGHMEDKGTGGKEGLIQLAKDVKSFAKGYVLSNIPPNVRDYFVFFQAEASRLAALNATSKRLISALKKNFWVPPSPRNVPYTLSNPQKEDGSDGQVLKLMQIFQNKKKGFFIECGASDGETASSTLYLERRMNWTGVLIEASPDQFSKLLAKNRKSILIPACLSPKNRPLFTKFLRSETGGKVVLTNMTNSNSTDKNLFDVFCFPFVTIYEALGNISVDLFILNASGFEMDVLRTIPWEYVKISTMIVGVQNMKEQKEIIKTYLDGKDYEMFVDTQQDEQWASTNLIFTKKAAKKGKN